MHYLSDQMLMDAYKKAKELKLEKDFLELLKEELIRRKIDLTF
ncbi:sporulation histidine kinase inhibitor Sda [Oceanobacillus saliphilus]|nr:sporulation histidine kinase inhibitor Sda [Oceanobacillus saliphilus]